MKKYLKIGFGLLMLMSCSQAITIPDQEYLVTMNALNNCWRDNASAAICNCAANKVKETYPTTGQLKTAMMESGTRAQAQATIQDALLICDPNTKAKK